jgi:hypothetical protein
MRRSTRARKEMDAIGRFSEIFPKRYFGNNERAAESLKGFSEALQSGRVVTIFVKPRGWIMKGAKNRKWKLDRWREREGIARR